MGNKGKRKTLATVIFENPTTNLAFKSLQQIDEQGGFLHLVFHGKYIIIIYINLSKPRTSHGEKPTCEFMLEGSCFSVFLDKFWA